MSFQIDHHTTPQKALDACLDFWTQREVINNLGIGLLSKAKDLDKPIPGFACFTMADANGICATAFTSRKRWIVSYSMLLPGMIEAIAGTIQDLQLPYEGVLGEKEGTDQLAHLIAPGEKPSREMMAHELTSVTDIPLSSGVMVLADESHLELTAQWGFRFQQELNMTPARTAEQWLNYTQESIDAKNLFCWLNEQGEVVSMCVAVRETPSASIIGGVYTPPELRGHGYARSCVHQATVELLRRGKRFCGLFTDLSNPVSNKIYHQIGYWPVAEFSDYLFAPKTA